MSKVLLVLCLVFFFALPLFAQSVDTAWVRRYNGPANSDDEASAIALDSSGNVYVTGQSSGSGTYDDYATVKYDSAGNKLWVQRYNGPGNYEDWAFAIGVDGFGNVYVTGESRGSGTYYDYATVKYDSAGNQLWVQRYNGPGNYSDGACAIAIDGSGNIYVTGHSGGSTEQYDYATVKYDPDGNQLWVQRYNGPGNSYDWAQAIALDGFGNDYVTGTSNGKWAETYEDYATVKYDSSGNQLWVQRYNGPGNYTDGACAITIDGSGNVYVTGTSAGEMSTIDDDYATIKYDSQGNQLWVQRYNGPLNYNDGAYAIALDGFGNVYVTGYSCGSGTYEDYATVKYDSSGNQLWVQRYNGPGNYSDEARAIETDGSGNVYVTGTSYGNGAHYDYATVKYDSAGNQLWVQRPGNYSDEARAIDTDGSGNVYVTGWGYGSGTERDYSTIKYIQFLRGDVNADKKLNVSDVVYLINYLFKGGPTPNPLQSGDANCDGQVTVSDVVYLINYLFKGGPSPC